MNESVYRLIGMACILLSVSCGSREATYEGYVKDAETGDPLADVKVYTFDPESKKKESIQTDPSGFYRLPVLKLKKSAEIRYSIVGYKRKSQEIDTIKRGIKRGKGRIVLPDVLLNIDTVKQVIYRGKVKDAETGEPLSGVGVTCMNIRVSTTSTCGNYLVSFVGGNKRQKMVFTKSGYAKVSIDTVLQSLGRIMNAPDLLMQKEASDKK